MVCMRKRGNDSEIHAGAYSTWWPTFEATRLVAASYIGQRDVDHVRNWQRRSHY